MNNQSKIIRLKLLKKYYKTAALGWFHPKSLHWAKMVTNDGYWKWIRPHSGIRNRLVRNPPIHLYQSVLQIKSENVPRGSKTRGYFLGGSLLFDIDIIKKKAPFSIWKVIDAVDSIKPLVETIEDMGGFRLKQIVFSGFRGFHVYFEEVETIRTPICTNEKNQRWLLRAFTQKRNQLARAVGYWLPEWDWKVSADIWRVARVPWSIHGNSSLRAIPLKKSLSSRILKDSFNQACVFSDTRNLSIRMLRKVPTFSYIDGVTYGPFRKGWTTKLPVSVALHLIWQDFAKLREKGLEKAGLWFKESWQTLFRDAAMNFSMGNFINRGDGS